MTTGFSLGAEPRRKQMKHVFWGVIQWCEKDSQLVYDRQMGPKAYEMTPKASSLVSL
jgi:hypothetical protein